MPCSSAPTCGVKRGRCTGVVDIDTLTKAKIARAYWMKGGDKTPGAATATAKEFGIKGSGLRRV